MRTRIAVREFLLLPACVECNSKKHRLPVEDFAEGAVILKWRIVVALFLPHWSDENVISFAS